MSIYIKGLEMPKDDELLCINIHPDGKVSINLDLQCKQIATSVEVPPHGDLIDIDKAIKCIPEHYEKSDLEAIIAAAPTIIPADPAEEDEECQTEDNT